MYFCNHTFVRFASQLKKANKFRIKRNGKTSKRKVFRKCITKIHFVKHFRKTCINIIALNPFDYFLELNFFKLRRSPSEKSTP
jgi:hypothetical protein